MSLSAAAASPVQLADEVAEEEVLQTSRKTSSKRNIDDFLALQSTIEFTRKSTSDDDDRSSVDEVDIVTLYSSLFTGVYSHGALWRQGGIAPKNPKLAEHQKRNRLGFVFNRIAHL